MKAHLVVAHVLGALELLEAVLVHAGDHRLLPGQEARALGTSHVLQRRSLLFEHQAVRHRGKQV
jgi:hypothetical protein